jgi:Suppressor of fused protein (SUFU)
MMWQEYIKNHYRDFWNTEEEVCKFSSGPIYDLPNGFSVLKFPPHGDRDMWTYATCCMSLPVDEKPIELHFFSAFQADEIAELLVATAHYHRTSAKLDIGHSVNFGRPWLNESKCEYGLISLPYLDGPKLEILKLGSRTLNFYWLIPVSASEVEFKKKNGLEALELEFDRSRFDYLNHRREVVV